MQHFEDIIWGRGGDNGRGNYLIHRFVVTGMARVVDKSGTAAVHVWGGLVCEICEDVYGVLTSG